MPEEPQTSLKTRAILRRMRRLVPLLLTLAAAVATAASGCGGDAPAAGATPSAAVAPQAVDRLRPHPRAIDPSAGVPAGRSGVLARASASLPKPRTDAEIRRELAASGIPSGTTAM